MVMCGRQWLLINWVQSSSGRADSTWAATPPWEKTGNSEEVKEEESLFPHPQYREEAYRVKRDARKREWGGRDGGNDSLEAGVHPPPPHSQCLLKGLETAGMAATDRNQAGSPLGAVSDPGSWFLMGQSCSCSDSHDASSGKGPSRAEGSRPTSDAERRKKHVFLTD